MIGNRHDRVIRQIVRTGLIVCLLLVVCPAIAAEESKPDVFQATGPMEPVQLGPRQEGAVKVTFDLLPTTMSFDLPSFPCLVTENGIKYSSFWAETYDLRECAARGG